MRLCVIGSRNYPDLAQVREFIRDLSHAHGFEEITVVSGGARGVDATVEMACEDYGVNFELFPANWKRYGRGAGMKRNAEMIKTVDEVIAFYDGVSNGTANSIKWAENLGLPLTVVTPAS